MYRVIDSLDFFSDLKLNQTCWNKLAFKAFQSKYFFSQKEPIFPVSGVSLSCCQHALKFFHEFWYTPWPRNFRRLGPSSLPKITKTKITSYVVIWWEKKPKITRYLGCLDRKLWGMSIIQNTKNYENENYEGENYKVTVYINPIHFYTLSM